MDRAAKMERIPDNYLAFILLECFCDIHRSAQRIALLALGRADETLSERKKAEA
jgi:hypothetical protein